MSKKIVAILLAIIILFPFCYAFSLSFFPRADFFEVPTPFFPSEINLTGYAKAITMPQFLRYTANSIITATSGALIRTLVAFIASFAFTYLQFRGKNALLFFLTLSAFIPGDALLFENYMTVMKAGLGDTYLGIIAPSLFSAMQMLMMLTAMKSIPKDPYEAALLDGANDGTVMWHITMPLVKCVILTVIIQSFIGIYNSYLWPLVITNKPDMRTIQIGISLLGFAESGDKAGLFAALIITLIPFALIVLVARKVMIRALSDGLSN